MKKKTLIFGDQEFTIAELNTAQVDELTSFQPAEGEDANAAWQSRQWRTILLALNNAAKAPTKESPLGSDTEPQSADGIRPVLGFASKAELHNEILKLSGLRSAAVGESKATVDKPSTSGTSTAA